MISVRNDQRIHSVIMLGAYILSGFLCCGVCGQCSLPTVLQNTMWMDSEKGELVFDASNMTGWDLDYQGNTGDPLVHWECFYKEADSSSIYLVFKLSQTIDIYGDEFNAFMCMELTQVTEYSFYYYLLWSDYPPRFNYDRISGQYVNTTIIEPRSEVCLDASNPAHAAVYPHVGEYHVLLKQDAVPAARQECPDSFFGVYTYTITDLASNSESCGNTYDVLDVCSDYTSMSFNNSLCNTSIAYSENGSLACITSLVSGDYTYHTLYNEDDTVDEISTHRFTCFVSSLASDGSLQVSQTMGSCKKDQTPDSQPMFPNGSVAGLNIQFTPNRLCPKTSDDTESGLSTGAIIGITFGVILLIVVIIVAVCVCIRCRQPSKGKEKLEEKKTESSPRENSYDNSTGALMHQQSREWNNGFPGEPPNDTNYSRDKKSTPTADKFNPFSVPPLSNGQVYKDEGVITTLKAESKLAQNQTVSSAATTSIQRSRTDSTKGVSNTAQSFKRDHKVEVDVRKEEIGGTRMMHEDLSIKSEHKLPINPFSTQRSTPRNTNIIPLSFLQQANFADSKTCQDIERQKAKLEQNTEDKAVEILPENKHTVFSNDNGKHTLAIAHGVYSRRSMTMTPVAGQKTTEINMESTAGSMVSKPNTESQQYEHAGEEMPNKLTRQSELRVQEPFKLENNPPNIKHRKSVSNTIKPQSNYNRKLSKTQLATSNQNSKQKGHDALAGSRSVNFHRRQNKRGTFYNENAIIIAEPQSHMHLSGLNETVYSDTGIYYEDDNECERAMVKTIDADKITPQMEYGVNEKLYHATPSDDPRASVNSTLSPSRISHITMASSRLTDTPTNNIDRRGVKYFIDNETNSIVISVKSVVISEENTGDRESDGTLTGDVEDDLDLEDEDLEELNGNSEKIKQLEEVDTAMTVIYGDDEDDPDRLILRGYEPDLLTIKE